jgi:hypothetical protein
VKINRIDGCDVNELQPTPTFASIAGSLQKTPFRSSSFSAAFDRLPVIVRVCRPMPGEEPQRRRPSRAACGSREPESIASKVEEKMVGARELNGTYTVGPTWRMPGTDAGWARAKRKAAKKVNQR